MEKIRTRRQIFKSSSLNLRSLQTEQSSAAGCRILDKANRLVLLRLFYQDATKVRLKDIVYCCK